MTGGYYRTSSPVTALPMIMRWISDVPSKIVKLVEVRAVSAGRCPADHRCVSTNSARRRPRRDLDAFFATDEVLHEQIFTLSGFPGAGRPCSHRSSS
jgi:hypothetical protein